MTGYGFHPEALADLDEIWKYISADSIDAADRMIAEVLSTIRTLAPFSSRGHKRPDLSSRPLRFVQVRDYLVAYAPDEETPWIIAILHGRRNPRVLAALLRDRE